MGSSVKDPQTDSVKVGSGGSKGVTILVFTEGKAFVELEFDGPPNMLPPPDFVIDVGQNKPSPSRRGSEAAKLFGRNAARFTRRRP